MRATLLAAALAVALQPAAVVAQSEAELEQINEKIAALDWFIGEGIHGLQQAGATVATGADEAFLQAPGANEFMQLTQGHGNYDLEGLLYTMEGAQADSFVTFGYDPVGFVQMDDWSEAIDADNLMASIQQGTAAANARLAEGYEEIFIDGWVQEPYLDREQQVVYWAIRGHDSSGIEFINARALKLGRRGMAVLEWVGGPEQFANADEALAPSLERYVFDEGFAYADFDPAVDDVASFGIGAIAYQMLTGENPAVGLGLVAGALLLLKKFWWIVLLPFALLARWLKGRQPGPATD